MQVHSARWRAIILSLFLPALVACGAQSAATPQTKTTAPPGETLYVLDGYAATGAPDTSPRHILAVHPTGNGAAQALATLPAGLTTLDHQRLYTAVPKSDGTTAITVLDTRTGTALRTFAIPGGYSTADLGFTSAALTVDGRWLALRQASRAGQANTTIALVDTEIGALAKTFSLGGNFDLDAIGPGGHLLYLLENLGDAAHRYYVRAYNADAGRLIDGIIVDKSEVNEQQMTGTGLTRQLAADGSAAYTLYINPARNQAFVHILPLASAPDSGPYFARCVDLPAGKDARLLQYYTLALAADGKALYAANAALGQVSKISISAANFFDDHIISNGQFSPTEGPLAGASSGDVPQPLYNGAALSPDQATLYVAGVRGVWAIGTADMQVHNTYAMDQAFTGVAASGDGKSLYAVAPARGITVLDVASRQTRSVLQGPARAPWGIAWIRG
jgi:DNA-binding beta-propeller fold protein YncE